MFFRAVDIPFYWYLGVSKVFKDFKYIKQLEKFEFLFLLISFLSLDFSGILTKGKKTKKTKKKKIFIGKQRARGLFYITI